MLQYAFMATLSIHDLTRRSTGRSSPLYQPITSFNSRPHKEVDCRTPSEATYACAFQFTTSQGGRQHPQPICLLLQNFQFTTSQGGRQSQVRRGLSLKSFQFTTSQGGRLASQTDITMTLRTFNSRPHKEVDKVLYHLHEIISLSIHDLTRRSTIYVMLSSKRANLSIHDLTRRSTSPASCQDCIVDLSIHDLTRRSTKTL